MKITIECFGAAQRWCGAPQIELELPAGADSAAALDLLAQRFPEFAARRAGVAVAIGDAVITAPRALQAGARLALIPPVSGG